MLDVSMEKLLEIYNLNLKNNANFIHVKEDGDYFYIREGDILHLMFQGSDSHGDWVNNFDFFAIKRRPYKDMEINWRCHRGFLRVWKAIEPYVKDMIMDPTVKKIIVSGYSHGAAIATLAHEYVWFNRPDLRDVIEGYGFGAPRVFGGFRVPNELKERWERFVVIRNCNDIVTHVPPAIFGFTHVVKPLQIGEKGKIHCQHIKLNCANVHYACNYQLSLGETKDENFVEFF